MSIIPKALAATAIATSLCTAGVANAAKLTPVFVDATDMTITQIPSGGRVAPAEYRVAFEVPEESLNAILTAEKNLKNHMGINKM